MAAVALVATALLFAACLRLRSFTSFVLAAYVAGSAAIVGTTEVLSPFDEVTRGGYLAAELVLLGVGVAAWLVRGRPLPRVPHIGVTNLRGSWVVVGLAGLVVLAAVFQLFLVVATPPDNGDSMTYHLSRAAAWFQLHAVRRIAGAWEPQNAYPPNGEIEVLWTMVFWHGDRLAALPQFVARPVLIVGIYGLARRLRFAPTPSLFAALVFSCLTVVAAESVTTQNDLVVAALVLSGLCLAMDAVHGERGAAVVAGVAAGVAVGTKLTAIPGLVAALIVVAVTAAAVSPFKRLALWSLVGFVAFGAVIYLRNWLATGNALGDVGEISGIQSHFSITGGARTVVRYLLDFGDNSAYFKNANEDSSYFGTLGWTLIVPLSAIFIGLWVAGRTTAARAAAASTLPVYLVLLAYTHGYDRFSGRLIITGVALCAPLIAAVYPIRVLRFAVGGLAATTLVLTLLFNPAKPVGLTARQPAVWHLSRVQAQALRLPAMAGIDRTLDRVVPANARLGAVIAPSAWSYPLFGPRLTRRVIYLGRPDAFAHARRLGLKWVAFSVGESPGHPLGWRVLRFRDSGWALAKRLRT